MKNYANLILIAFLVFLLSNIGESQELKLKTAPSDETASNGVTESPHERMLDLMRMTQSEKIDKEEIEAVIAKTGKNRNQGRIPTDGKELAEDLRQNQQFRQEFNQKFLAERDKFRPSHADFDNIRYVVCVNKTNYLMGEPIFIAFSMQNQNNRVIEVINFGMTQISLEREEQCRAHDVISERRLLHTDPIKISLNYGDYTALFGMPQYIALEKGKNVALSLRKTKEINLTHKLNGEHLNTLRPGYYRMVCECNSFYPKIICDPPKQSNTVTFRIRSGPGFASKDLKEPGAWNNPAEQPLRHGELVTFHDLSRDIPPAGDYSKVRYVLRANKEKYKEGEPVFIRLFVKNESEGPVNLCRDTSAFWQDHRWFLTHNQWREVPKTRLGKRRISEKTKAPGEIDWQLTEPCFVTLESGCETEIGPGEIQLDLYHDLSMPGRYRLKTSRSTLIPGQEFTSPLESNELQFDILTGKHLKPEDLLEPGNFETQSLP